MKEVLEKLVTDDESGKRLDIVVREWLPDFTRTRIQDLIEEGEITVRGETSKANYKVKPGDEVVINFPEPENLDVQPENIDLEIVYEDSDLLVVNKPQGMVVHPAAGNYTGTLVNALLYHCQDLSGINGVVRPGIVHRIDKDTSGLLVVAKNDKSHVNLAEQIKEHTVARKYMAIVHGTVIEPKGVVDAPIGRAGSDRKKMAVVTKNSKNAVTRYTVLERFHKYTMIECALETGRTHQIRVHLSYIGHPVAGDPLYGPKKNPLNLAGQALHAFLLGFIHPSTGEYMEFKAPLPDYFQKLIENLRNPESEQ